jgi:arabinoxylan arabinofuranohydrolase
MKKKMVLIFIFLFCSFAKIYSQYLDNTTLQNWVDKDSLYDSSKNANPVLPGYFADPTIIEDSGIFYIYATSDLKSWDAITKMSVWSSSDLKNWKCSYVNWPAREEIKSDTGKQDGIWAPCVVKNADGKFYMYVTIGREIWVGVANHPLGPWKNARKDNTPLIRHKEFYYVETIDAECFIDEDGQAYLYWGSSDSGMSIEGRCLVLKLNKDMVSFNEKPRDVTPPYYFEAPYMFKKEGTYYLMYSYGKTWDQTYQVRYAKGKTPFGPWEEGKIRPLLIGNDQGNRITSTGHHTMLNYRGKNYIVYHRFNTLDKYDVSAKLRQVAIDELIITPEGDMQHVITTHRGTLPKIKDNKINLAFGATVSTSSELDSVCKTKYVNDENNGTLWIAKGKELEWITLNFEKEIALKKIEIYFEYPIYSYAYTIEISNNGRDWACVDNQFSNTKNGSPMVLDKELKTRYLRVNLIDNEKTPRFGIWEVKVY